ncbi:PAS domain-containing protein [Massilia sp. AB1]|uniref:PAS domain-containing protein n=1 Tax=Massilia sp. AB1 TaxID=2823371 RepID=UPI001B810FA2|nr:PAS domain-containing protein [Massilia sp. AB1]MBQ5941808.1 PAS domain-containing protein [Massilia sp. AB1]
MPFSRHSLPTIRSKLYTLVLACALPILIGYIALARDAAVRERSHVSDDAQTVAEVLAAAVDRDLDSGETAARVLANSPTLARGELESFHAAARLLLRPEFPAQGFMLSGPGAVPLLHTRYSYGAPLPLLGNPDDIRRVFATGDSIASGLHRAEGDQPYALSVDVPVWIDGKVRYVLSVLLRPRRLTELLESQHLPDGWAAEIYDKRLLMVSRSSDPSAHVGAPMAPALAERLARDGRGTVLLGSGEEAGFAAYARSPKHGWVVAIRYPTNAARELLGHSLATTVIAIAVLLIISLGLARALGGAIARAVRDLAEPAESLGRGEPLALPPPEIDEVDKVARSLQRVDAELQAYRTRLETLVDERTAELARSKAQLEIVYASAPVGLCFMDTNMRVVMINDYLAEINALSAREHIGHTLPELLGPVGSEFEVGYRKVLETGRPLLEVEATGEVPATPGQTRHWISSYYPVWGPEHQLMGVNAVVLDITERKRQEQRNRDNEEMFRVLFEGSSDAQVLIAFGAGYVSANQAAADLFGYPGVDALLNESPVSTSPPFQGDGRPTAEAAMEYMRRAIDTGRCQFEWLHRRADGSLFHADVLLSRIDIGGAGMMAATIRDISARVEAEAALHAASAQLAERERFLRTVTDNLPALVGYWDAQQRCRFANRPYLDWLGRSEEDVLGRTAAELLPAEQLAQVKPFLEAVLTGAPQTFERTLSKPGGAIIQALSNFIPEVDDAGQVRGFYMLHTDVTDLKHVQSQLVGALHQAEAASRAKGEFLANMSHELRTPMNAIVGLARLLEEGQLGRRERGYVSRMQTAARSLLGMLSDLLNFSRIESGQLVLERTPFAVDSLLASIAVITAPNAWAKGVEPVFAVAPDVPATLLGDPMRLEQVLLNLVGNAVKFTERGEIVLSIRVVKRAADQVELGFSVRDTGIGIAPEQQARMFEAFSQGDSSTSRKYGGAGLGLAIARRLVELAGGRLGLTSAAGAGADFHFTLPFVVVDDARPLPAGAGQPLRVLVADDNHSAWAALAAACAAYGWSVDGAGGGQAALDKLRSGQRYDLAFLDAAMPDLDGVEVLSSARADNPGALPRVCLLVADPDAERMAELANELQLGAVLGKPFTPTTLRAAADRLLGGDATSSSAPGQAAPLAARLLGLRVLLVEDNPINQEVASFILTHAGASVDIAGNGRVAVSMLAERADYDVVLMDVQMPVMNGYEAAAAIRAAGLALPIVAMTANAMEEDRARSLAAGMQAHLAKPIDVDELVATLARIVPRAAAPCAATGKEEASQAAPMPVPAHLPGIDLQATLPRFGGSFERFAAVFGRFVDGRAAALAELRLLVDAGDRQAAQQATHRLRGVAANLGAVDVARAAHELELALRNEGQPTVVLRLAELAAALDVAAAGARELENPTRDAALPLPAEGGGAALQDALARLLHLLENNNMKATTQFEVLRPALAARYGQEAAAALAEAVGTLRFGEAAARIRELLEGKAQA